MVPEVNFGLKTDIVGRSLKLKSSDHLNVTFVLQLAAISVIVLVYIVIKCVRYTFCILHSITVKLLLMLIIW
jgi:hypothetical protein